MNPIDHGTTHRAAASLLRLIDLNSSLWIGCAVIGALLVLGTELGAKNPAQAQEKNSATHATTATEFSEGSNSSALTTSELSTVTPSLPNFSAASFSRLPALQKGWGQELALPKAAHQSPISLEQDLTTKAASELRIKPYSLDDGATSHRLATQNTFSQNSNTSSKLLAQTAPVQVEPAQTESASKPSADIRRQGSSILGTPSIQLQGVVLNEGDEFSARARAIGIYPISPNSLFGAVVDLTTGNAFSDSPIPGLRLNELYFATSPANIPSLRFVVGLMDLTSYFDRNSFAKDGASHFFNRAFQTNPALSAAGLESRVGALVNWNVTDNIELKAAGFSSSRFIGDFALDAFAGEAGFRFGNLIVRGTYVTSRDAGRRTGFEEIFDIPRVGRLGPQRGDRENAYGINAEYFIPNLNIGLFGRYGHYENTALDAGADTYSFGLSFLDLFMRDDRLGLAYGRQLSNDDLRRQRDDKIPDVLELYYDFRLTSFLRAGFTLQERNQFSETVFGFRLKTEFDVSPRR